LLLKQEPRKVRQTAEAQFFLSALTQTPHVKVSANSIARNRKLSISCVISSLAAGKIGHRETMQRGKIKNQTSIYFECKFMEVERRRRQRCTPVPNPGLSHHLRRLWRTQKQKDASTRDKKRLEKRAALGCTHESAAAAAHLPASPWLLFVYQSDAAGAAIGISLALGFFPAPREHQICNNLDDLGENCLIKIVNSREIQTHSYIKWLVKNSRRFGN
jgi:hypothetical protein